MTKTELLEILWQVWEQEVFPESALTAVEAYSSASNNGKPIVSGSLPKFDADGFKRWMSGWVEPKYISTIAAHVEKMLGGNDR